MTGKSLDQIIDQLFLYVTYNTEEIRHVYISKHNSKHENQVVLLMITDNEK